MNTRIACCFFLVLLLSCGDKQPGDHQNQSASTQADSFSAPEVILLSGLPDSLQPREHLLDTAPKPRRITIPVEAGGFYANDATGEDRIALSPPVCNLLALLKYPNGEIVKDPAGNAFVMGYGGKSHFVNFTTDNGLAMDGILCSLTDHLGNLWFGTHGGLSRYDGKSFVNFTTAQGLAGNEISCMLEDRKGNFWFGTLNGGLSRYDGISFQNFSKEERHSGDVISSIVEDNNGNLWFGTLGSGLLRYNGKFFVSFSTEQGLASSQVRCISKDSKGNLWVGTLDSGVSRYDGTAFHNISDGLPFDDISCIEEDLHGNIWFGTFGAGLSRYDGKTFTNFKLAQGLGGNRIGSLFADRKGSLWIGTFGGGLSCYDGKSFVSFLPAQGLASKNITCITEDREGHLWMGSYGGGLSRYDGRAFVTFSSLQGLSDNLIYSIAEVRNGDLWFGTHSGGACRFDGRSFTLYTEAQGLAGNNIVSLANDCEDNLWLGTQRDGVSCYDGSSFTNYSMLQGLPAEYIRFIFKDGNCNLWFGTSNAGMSRFDGRSFVNYSTAQGLAGNSIRCITEDKKGNLWIGTESGLSRFDGKTIANFSEAQGMTNRRIWSVAVDSLGNLWVGTEDGLFAMPKKELETLEEQISRNSAAELKDKKSTVHFRRFIRRDGFPDNSINQIMLMPAGEIAIGTNQGIATFRPSPDFTKLVDIDIYNSYTDCPIKDVNNGQNCLFRDSRGIIWASTGNVKTALVRFDHSSLLKDTAMLTPMIQGIRIDGENILWHELLAQRKSGNKNDTLSVAAAMNEEVTTFGRLLSQSDRDSIKSRFENVRFDSISRFYPVPHKLVLPYTHNHVTIDFNAIETVHPTLVKYKYKLDGYDDDWSPPTSDHSATFGNIREGSYTFRLMAQSPNGVWSSPITYQFRVLAPWYRTWWALLVYVLSAVGVMLVFSKWRQQKLRREKAKLLRMVKERTNDVVKEKRRVEKEKQRSDELLLNILPAEVAEELKLSGTAKARHFDDVTVLFTDFVEFTRVSEKMSPQDLIDELNTCFTAFDAITSKYDIEKIKTIGDAYLAVAGVPVADPNHALNVVRAAQEIQQFMKERYSMQRHSSFQIRIGIHSGSVVAGIVGIKKFGYDIWGDTVNTAARMEQNSDVGKINISHTTYHLVKDHFTCIYRGEIHAKNKGDLKMYFVEESVMTPAREYAG